MAIRFIHQQAYLASKEEQVPAHSSGLRSIQWQEYVRK
jgi:hypothetical protein